MSTPSRIVIVGASLAGATAAVTLREAGFTGSITLIGDETHRPYERPPLSKALLQGETDHPDWVAPSSHYADHDIALLEGVTATAVRPGDRVVVAGGEEHAYDRLLLATGAAPRRLDVPGADLAGVHYLRTLDDALELRARLKDGARVAVIGAGWIGCEVAASARARGASVTMIAPEDQPLVRVLGGQVGASFAALHREHDVDLRLGVGVASLGGESSVCEVRLTDGTSVEVDLVVAGLGAVPNVALADAAGLELAAGGIAVDATLRTSAPDVYAAGDVAAHAHPAYAERLRIEHWATAKDQGEHVAANLAGASEPYTKQPFFFSDQYDLGCEYRGHADPAHDRLVVRGSLEDREYQAFWLRGDTVAAALNVNLWDDGDALQELVDTGRSVADTDLPGPA